MVVAEDVETQSQFRTLGELDCDQMQGFPLSRPMQASELPAFIDGMAGRVIAAGRVRDAPVT
ncbi:cyclic-di-GMP phosphodiesterase [Caballeronia temeraria]|uniref:Cyclic-di-GMP phosphodiesterase n=1 Tax=Caballeronia temeraria TaxID=1777137 RepID=A0A157ZSN4_9BURK|nr:cyclic-di-GMP phosphodiesterase [Caballeronia temeraria]